MHIARKRMVSMDWAFTLKATLELYPFRLLTGVLVLSVLVFAYLVPVCGI